MSELRTLLLNAWMAPHAVLTWNQAVTLIYQRKVDILEEYKETVSSPSTTYFVPAVLRLRKNVVHFRKRVTFCRLNVFTRDDYRCQYCGIRKPSKDLTYDHVLPRRAGGKTTWTNIVSACRSCNENKGGRTPEQAQMPLLRKPARPHSLPLHTVLLNPSTVPEAWLPYLTPESIEPDGSIHFENDET